MKDQVEGRGDAHAAPSRAAQAAHMQPASTAPVDDAAKAARLGSKLRQQRLQAMRELSGIGGIDRERFGEPELFTHIHADRSGSSLNSELLDSLHQHSGMPVQDEMAQGIVVAIADQAMNALDLAYDPQSYQVKLEQAWHAQSVAVCKCREQGVELVLRRDERLGLYVLRSKPLNDHLLVCPFGRTLRNSLKDLSYVMTGTGVAVKFISRRRQDHGGEDVAEEQAELLAMRKLSSDLAHTGGRVLSLKATEGVDVERFWASGKGILHMLKNIDPDSKTTLTHRNAAIFAAASIAPASERLNFLSVLPKTHFQMVASLLWGQAGLTKRTALRARGRLHVFGSLARAAEELHHFTQPMSSVLYVVADSLSSDSRRASALRDQVSEKIMLDLAMNGSDADVHARGSMSIRRSNARGAPQRPRRLLIARVDAIASDDFDHYLYSLGMRHSIKLGQDVMSEWLRTNRDCKLVPEALASRVYISPADPGDHRNPGKRGMAKIISTGNGRCTKLGFDLYVLAQCVWHKSGVLAERVEFITTTHEGFPVADRSEIELLSRLGQRRCIARSPAFSTDHPRFGPIQLADCDKPTLLTQLASFDSIRDRFPGFDYVRYGADGELLDALPDLSQQIARTSLKRSKPRPSGSAEQMAPCCVGS